MEVYAHIKLYTIVYSNSIHNHEKLETTQWINKQQYIYALDYLLLSRKKEWTTDTCVSLDESQRCCAEWKASLKRLHTIWFYLCDILVHSGCRTKLTIDWVNKHLFLIVLEARSRRSSLLADLVFGEISSPGSEMAIFLLCPHLAEGQERSLDLSLIPFMGVSSSQPNHLQALLPNTITLGIRF